MKKTAQLNCRPKQPAVELIFPQVLPHTPLKLENLIASWVFSLVCVLQWELKCEAFVYIMDTPLHLLTRSLHILALSLSLPCPSHSSWIVIGYVSWYSAVISL